MYHILILLGMVHENRANTQPLEHISIEIGAFEWFRPTGMGLKGKVWAEKRCFSDLNPTPWWKSARYMVSDHCMLTSSLCCLLFYSCMMRKHGRILKRRQLSRSPICDFRNCDVTTNNIYIRPFWNREKHSNAFSIILPLYLECRIWWLGGACILNGLDFRFLHNWITVLYIQHGNSCMPHFAGLDKSMIWISERNSPVSDIFIRYSFLSIHSFGYKPEHVYLIASDDPEYDNDNSSVSSTSEQPDGTTEGSERRLLFLSGLNGLIFALSMDNPSRVLPSIPRSSDK